MELLWRFQRVHVSQKLISNNNSINVKEERDYSWGYCPKSCTGQTVSPLSPFNLARRSNTNLWSEFYDFSVWENNFCHTYDPPEKSNPDFLNRVMFMIAKNPNYIDQNYKIFIHERGQFWPRYDMMSFGQPDPLMLSPNKELEIFFSINQITRFSKRGGECVEEMDYSFTQCLHNYARSASKCHIGAKESFIKYFQILIHLKRKNIANVKMESGCYPKCRHIIYTLVVIEKTMDGHSNWTSEVFIQPKSSEVKFSTEYYSFDRNDLISSIGGNLGLFLGWSLLTLYEAISILFMIANLGKCFMSQ